MECLTDNVNRTVSEVRHAFSRSGGNLGTDGSVAWMFVRKGMIIYDKAKITDFEAFFELALENGAEDVREEEESIEVVSAPEDFQALRLACESVNSEPDFCEITMIPENSTEINEDQAVSLEKLVGVLEDNDDVQNVYHNAQIE